MDNEALFYAYFTALGLSEFGAAGLLGNIAAESGCDPRNLQNSFNTKLGLSDADYVRMVDDGTYTNFVHDGAGFGLAQWTYHSRKKMLLDYVSVYGCSIGDMGAQMEFLAWELQNHYGSVWKILTDAVDVRTASDAVLTKYEKPSDMGESVRSYRAALGVKYYDTYHWKGADDRMSCTFGSAKSSYGNTARGDQSGGKEVATEKGYVHSKKWRQFRAKDPAKRAMIAYAMKVFCKNDLIGYSQNDRMALYNQIKPYNFDPNMVKEKTNCDCSSLVRVCCLYAGINVANFTTADEPSKLLATGAFEEIDWSGLNKVASGDILVTATKGHTVVCVASDYVPPDNIVTETVETNTDKNTDNTDKNTDTSENKVTVKSGTWNIRNGPGTDYDKVCQVAGGTQLEVIKEVRWLYVRSGNVSGYISAGAIEGM